MKPLDSASRLPIEGAFFPEACFAIIWASANVIETIPGPKQGLYAFQETMQRSADECRALVQAVLESGNSAVTAGGSSTPLEFDNPWSGFSATGDVSPLPPFASPSQLPPSNVSFATFEPAALGAVLSTNLKIGLTQSWNLSIEQQFGKDWAMHRPVRSGDPAKLNRHSLSR